MRFSIRDIVCCGCDLVLSSAEPAINDPIHLSGTLEGAPSGVCVRQRSRAPAVTTRSAGSMNMLRYASAVRLASTLISLDPNCAATLLLGKASAGTGRSREFAEWLPVKDQHEIR